MDQESVDKELNNEKKLEENNVLENTGFSNDFVANNTIQSTNLNNKRKVWLILAACVTLFFVAFGLVDNISALISYNSPDFSIEQYINEVYNYTDSTTGNSIPAATVLEEFGFTEQSYFAYIKGIAYASLFFNIICAGLTIIIFQQSKVYKDSELKKGRLILCAIIITLFLNLIAGVIALIAINIKNEPLIMSAFNKPNMENVETNIDRLEKMKDDGIITNDEFDSLKNRIEDGNK